LSIITLSHNQLDLLSIWFLPNQSRNHKELPLCHRKRLKNTLLLQTFGDSRIEIGENSEGSGIVISSRSHVQIGKNVNLGGNLRVFDHDFHALDFEKRRLPFKEQEPFVRSSPIQIGDDVFVGANAMILKGVTIGPRTIIAAGSVVIRGEYPADVILAGNPATIRQKTHQADNP
jgi:acetyltransferase-like isoleucine patch superfamily enzyme